MATSKIFKIYLLNSDSSVKAIRKFAVAISVAKSFANLCEKLQQICPELHSRTFTVSWRDTANDEIIISSDEELEIALTELQGIGVIQLYVKLNLQESPCSKESETSNTYKADVKHDGIVCDGCNGAVYGFRFKCVQCEDFDLCSQCANKGLHPHHCMLRLSEPMKWPQSRSLQHHVRKIIKKHSARSCKKHGSNEHTSKAYCYGSSCSEAVLDLQDLVSVIFDKLIHYDESSEQAEEPSPNQTQNVEKPKKTEENGDLNDSACKKFPGEGKKLIDTEKDEKRYASNISDVSDASQNPTDKKVAADDWTIVDEAEAVEITQMPSAPESNQSQTIYPQLPEAKTEVHHPNPVINSAVEKMIEMGFRNQDKLLTYLLATENGDINRVIEILQHGNK